MLEYDIFLATDISSEESKARIPFYDSIVDLCQKLNHKCFAPHQRVGIGEISYEESKKPEVVKQAREDYKLIQGIIMPQVQLVLAYTDITDTMDVGIMVGRALELYTPVIQFYNKKNREAVETSWKQGLVGYDSFSKKVLDKLREERKTLNYILKVEFETDAEALQLLEKRIKEFFK